MKRSSPKPWGYLARQAARKSSRSRSAASPTELGPPHAAGVPAPVDRGRAVLLFIAAATVAVLPALRLFHLVAWTWALALAPLTAIGAACAVGLAVFSYREQLVAIRTRLFGAPAGGEAATPPPDHLEPPPAAVESGDAILAEHPEILAALCHGFRMKRPMPSSSGSAT